MCLKVVDTRRPAGFDFLCGLPEPKRRRRLLLTIKAYIDDSGVKGTDPVFVLAGFIGRAERWAEFSDAWKQCLDASPSIQYLKMNEAVKLNGEFRSWEPKERNKKLADLVAIIKEFPQRAIHVTIDTEAFAKHHAPHLLPPMANPYFMGCSTMIAAVCYDVLDLGVAEQIEIIFDDQVIFKPRIQMWYPLIKEGWENYDSSLCGVLPPEPMFRDDKQYVPLQAADVVAWLFRTAFSGERTEFEWIATELMPVIPMSPYRSIFTAERMDRIQALSLKLAYPPEMIARWRDRLGLNVLRKLSKGRKKAKRSDTAVRLKFREAILTH